MTLTRAEMIGMAPVAIFAMMVGGGAAIAAGRPEVTTAFDMAWGLSAGDFVRHTVRRRWTRLGVPQIASIAALLSVPAVLGLPLPAWFMVAFVVAATVVLAAAERRAEEDAESEITTAR